MNERTIGVTPPRAMTIAGTDSSGGDGFAADPRTFAACGVHGCFAVTAVTVQNSLGVSGSGAETLNTCADMVGQDQAWFLSFTGAGVLGRPRSLR